MMITTRRVAFILSLLMMTAIPSKAGKFKYGLNHSISVTLKVPMPPKAYLGKRTARINLMQVPTNFGQRDRLVQSIQQSLSPDLDTSSANPETIFSVAIASYDPPAIHRDTVTETRSIKVGEKQLYNKDGKPQKDLFGNPQKQDIIQDRQVPVVYWQGRGNLSLRVEVKSSDGVLLDSFNPVSNFNRRITLSVNGVAQSGGVIQPDDTSILSELVDSVALQFKPRYCRTEKPESFLLAVDDELRNGDMMAEAGNWAEALKQWQGARMKKNGSDQEYNIAAAYEALAYDEYRQSGNVDKTIELFKKSMDLYTKAIQEDPNERYIRVARDRLQVAQNAMEDARKQYAVQQANAERLEQEMAEKQKAIEEKEKEKEKDSQEIQNALHPGGKAPQKPDTPDEASFRKMVRLRLKDMPGTTSNDYQDKLAQQGQQIYKLDAHDASLIVRVEVARHTQRDADMKDYRDTFAAYASDHKITAEERGILKDMRQRMDLSIEDVQTIESQFQFMEEGKAPGKATPKGAPPARKTP